MGTLQQREGVALTLIVQCSLKLLKVMSCFNNTGNVLLLLLISFLHRK